MPQTPFYSFLRSVINFLIRFVLGIFEFFQWICRISPLPDWLDWGLIGLLIIGIAVSIFFFTPGKN